MKPRQAGAASFLAFAIVLVAGCGGSTAPKVTPTTRSTAAPTATKTFPTLSPPPTPLIAGPDVRLCRGEDIASSAGPNGAGGMLFAFITLANRSSSPCQISQIPDIELSDAEGNVLPVTVTPGRPCPGNSCVFQQPILLLPGLSLAANAYPPQPGQALLELAWPYTDGKGAVCPAQTPKATQIKLLLHGVESAAVVDLTKMPHEGIVRCRGSISVVSYGPP